MGASVGVVVFPGTNCEYDAVHGASRRRRRGSLRLAPRAVARRPRRRGPPGRLRPRRLPAPGRDRPVLRGDGGRGGLRGRRWPGRRDLQRLPGPLRGRAPAGRAPEERRPHLPVPARRPRGHLDGLGAHAARPGSASELIDPDQPLLRRLRLRRADARGAARGRPHRAALHRQPERLGRRHRGHRQRGAATSSA